MPDMKKLKREMLKMQREMEQAQAEVAFLSAEGSAGGGMVKVVASGDGSLVSVRINPDAVDPEDVEMLEDMIRAAANDALKAVGELVELRMSAVTGDIKIPGLGF